MIERIFVGFLVAVLYWETASRCDDPQGVKKSSLQHEGNSRQSRGVVSGYQ